MTWHSQALERVEELGDLFGPVLKRVQKLPVELRKYFEKVSKRTRPRDDALNAYVAKRNFRKTAERNDACILGHPFFAPRE
jgi:hypothetical protein